MNYVKSNLLISTMATAESAMVQESSTKQSNNSTNKCCICEKPVKDVIQLCTKHWNEYEKKASAAQKSKKAFLVFQEYKKKIESGLIKHREY